MLYFHTALFDYVHPRLLTQKRIFPPRAAPRRSRRPAPRFKNKDQISIFKNLGCGAATYEPERLAVEISSICMSQKTVFFKK